MQRMGRYDRRINPDVLGSLDEGPQVDKKTQDESDFWHFVGNVAPAAGTALGAGVGALGAGLVSGGLGAPEGAALGGTLGGAAGTAVGALANNGASELTKDHDLEEGRKADRKQALLNALMSLRR